MPAVQLIKPVRFSDPRGWFAEAYNERRFAELGVDLRFVQDNQSFSAQRGTIRGLHFQAPPQAQAKLVRCIVGRIFDVVVDIRRGSPSFGRWISAELSAENGNQLLVPVGYAHGFLTLEPNTEVLYKVSNFYSPACDRGIVWDDPAIGVDWPLGAAEPLTSQKDAVLPRLDQIEMPFDFDGVPFTPIHN